jgi:hypothetical protein
MPGHEMVEAALRFFISPAQPAITFRPKTQSGNKSDPMAVLCVERSNAGGRIFRPAAIVICLTIPNKVLMTRTAFGLAGLAAALIAGPALAHHDF